MHRGFLVWLINYFEDFNDPMNYGVRTMRVGYLNFRCEILVAIMICTS